jgi:hypothetical protein
MHAFFRAIAEREVQPQKAVQLRYAIEARQVAMSAAASLNPYSCPLSTIIETLA